MFPCGNSAACAKPCGKRQTSDVSCGMKGAGRAAVRWLSEAILQSCSPVPQLCKVRNSACSSTLRVRKAVLKRSGTQRRAARQTDAARYSRKPHLPHVPVVMMRKRTQCGASAPASVPGSKPRCLTSLSPTAQPSFPQQPVSREFCSHPHIKSKENRTSRWICSI